MVVFINSIEPIEKKKARICFDNGIICQLYRGEVRSLHLEEGTYISEEVYRYIMTEILTKRATKRAMYLLEQMDRTEEQLRKKLLFHEYPVDCIDEAIVYVKKYHYLDDYRYACNFIRYAQEKNSRQQIVQKLMQKGVQRNQIELAIETEYQSDDIEKIKVLLEKRKYNSASGNQKEFQRTYQFLLRRGYKSCDILKAMNCKNCTIYCGL